MSLEKTIELIASRGKGILAADESTGTIGNRFTKISVENTEENRRAYRELLFTTPELEKYISGVILYDETIKQKTKEGTPFPEYLARKGIVPGIKVDKGLVALTNSLDEKITQGLDGLPEALDQYLALGAKFAKWREVFTITDRTPSLFAIQSNAEIMARYAAICQSKGIVPIVEPEVLMDGDHNIMACEQVTETILKEMFYALYRHGIILELMILKPNMIISGEKHLPIDQARQVGEATLRVLQRTVPLAIPTINFLSGGQSCEQATENLQAINEVAQNRAWHLSYSYGRALQQSALAAWGGKEENVKAAQFELHKRAKLNTAATLGEYSVDMEKM